MFKEHEKACVARTWQASGRILQDEIREVDKSWMVFQVKLRNLNVIQGHWKALSREVAWSDLSSENIAPAAVE